MVKKICLILLVFLEIPFVFLLICLLFDRSSNSYILPLKNNYYLEGFVSPQTEKVYLKNSRKNYIYPNNFPTTIVLGKIEEKNILFLECESKNSDNAIYYIINMESDGIIGPLKDQDFIEEIKDYWSVDILNWFTA